MGSVHSVCSRSFLEHTGYVCQDFVECAVKKPRVTMVVGLPQRNTAHSAVATRTPTRNTTHGQFAKETQCASNDGIQLPKHGDAVS